MRYLEAKGLAGPPQNKARTSTRATQTDTTVDATDAAIALAQEAGIDLSTLKGSGENGRITKPDVEAAIAASNPA